MRMLKNTFIYFSNIFKINLIDLQLRYNRSRIGPFWITISTAILIFGLTYINNSIFNTNLKEALIWITIGMVLWQYISSIILDSLDLFDNQKMLNLPITFLDRTTFSVFKNLIILFHNFLLVFVLIIYFKIPITKMHFSVIYGFILIIVNSFSITIIFGLLCLRFRDFVAIIKNLTYLIFLVTPIFWMPENISNNRLFIVDYNILYQIIQSIRDPLIGKELSTYNIYITLIFTLCILILAIFQYKKFYKQAKFWI